MILIISNKGDIHCNPVVKILTKKKYPFFRLNTEELTNDYQISFFYKKNKEFLILKNLKNGKILDSSQVTAIWDRRPLSQDIKLPRNKNIRKVISDEVNELNLWIRYFFDSPRMIGSSVWDRPNESKIKQIKITNKLIKKNKFSTKIPDTLITNDLKNLREFIQNKKFISIKPIGSDSFELDEKHEIPFVSRKMESKEIENNISQRDLDLCPVFLQEYIEKKYELRITSVGKKHFCCLIDSQKLSEGEGKEDWREGYDHGLEKMQKKIKTPKEIERFCNSYLDTLGINFGCFDFIKDVNNNFYFLECNPNGQWLWLEMEIGLKISKAIANFLMGHDD